MRLVFSRKKIFESNSTIYFPKSIGAGGVKLPLQLKKSYFTEWPLFLSLDFDSVWFKLYLLTMKSYLSCSCPIVLCQQPCIDAFFFSFNQLYATVILTWKTSIATNNKLMKACHNMLLDSIKIIQLNSDMKTATESKITMWVYLFLSFCFWISWPLTFGTQRNGLCYCRQIA